MMRYLKRKAKTQLSIGLIVFKVLNPKGEKKLEVTMITL